jgi:hypothetical protein
VEIILNSFKLFFKEVLYTGKGPHSDPLLKNLPAGRKEREKK